MKREHRILFAVNLVLIAGFGAAFIARLNYEFIIYVGVIVLFMGVVGISLRRVDYTLGSLVGLTVWSALHMAGGGILVGEGRLYDVMLVRISSRYPIWRYDQLVHMWGFGAATLVMFCLLGHILKNAREHPVALGIVVVMAGLGVGALNEILEFIVSIWTPESGVGGYINTSLDLCADLVGAVLGLAYIRLRYLRDPAGLKPA